MQEAQPVLTKWILSASVINRGGLFIAVPKPGVSLWHEKGAPPLESAPVMITVV